MEAFEVDLDHLPPSIMLVLEPPQPHRRVNGVRQIPS
jgi:hypothetical protein